MKDPEPAPNHPPSNWTAYRKRLTPERSERLERAAAKRIGRVRLVVQDLFHLHNVSACLRSAEAFGIQQVEVLTQKGKFKPSTVTKGVEKWLTIRRWDDRKALLATLRAEGFKVFAAYPKPGSLSLEAIPLEEPLALIFGNEKDGLDLGWADEVDACFHIPMRGLVESLNVSVAAAISLHSVVTRLEASGIQLGWNATDTAALLDSWAVD